MARRFVIRKSFDLGKAKVDYAKELNPQQLDVVQHGDGYCLVLAGAGSGKTRTIVYRVAWLLEHGVRPEEILLLTFTNKAAKEMLFRAEELLKTFPKGLFGGTFHHAANVFLRQYAPLLGYTPQFTILDEEDARDLWGLAIKDLHIDTKARRFPSVGVIHALHSYAVNTEQDFSEVVTELRPSFQPLLREITAVAKMYGERKHAANAMDFDDLLVNLARLLREHPYVRAKLAQRFRFVLVDEYQDTNPLQAAIVADLASVHQNLLVVGDDAQAIYGFRGADIRNILEFPKRFAAAKIFKLEINYRSTQPILDLANAVLEGAPKQFKKTLTHVREGRAKPQMVPVNSARQEAEFVAGQVLALREEGVPLRALAVLFRAAFHSQAVEFELTRRDIPYEYRGGVRFFERSHVKDALAFLKLLVNPLDEVAFHRALKIQPGIGPAASSTLFARSRSAVGDSHDVERVLQLPQDAVPGRAQAGWEKFRDLLAGLHRERAKGPAALVLAVTESDYRDYLEKEFPNSDERILDLEQLARFAEQFDAVEKFLADVALQEATALQRGAARDEERMVLSTIHQAKGLEWEAVFVIHLAEGHFPNRRAVEDGGMDEERRLFYVAVTRAKTHLFLTTPLSLGFAAGLELASPSPFLEEIQPNLLEKVEVSEEFEASDEVGASQLLGSRRRGRAEHVSGGDGEALDAGAAVDDEPIIALDGATDSVLGRVLKTDPANRRRKRKR